MTSEACTKRSGISGSALKMIAVVTMLIDHIAAAILVRHFYATNDWSLYTVYYAMRQIGRIAFPIYCFMLIEGLERTRSRTKYLLRMAGFALVSEIPFDLAFSSRVLEFDYQNVFFTLTIALAAMMGIEWIHQKISQPFYQELLTGLIALGGTLLGAILKTDYDWRGVLCVLLMYFARRRPMVKLVVGYATFVILLGEWAALPAFILLALYRGKKGFSCKYFFYGFYPVHLLILYVVCMLMGIAMYSAV